MGEEPTDALRKELVQWVRKEIGPIASPDLIQWAPGLPKTRSGKIMRRILRKIAENDYSNLGDTSTLADPGVVDDLINNRLNRGCAGSQRHLQRNEEGQPRPGGGPLPPRGPTRTPGPATPTDSLPPPNPPPRPRPPP